VGSLFRVLLFVGVVAKFWWLILAALIVMVAASLGWWCCMQSDATDQRARRERAALAAQADEQHAWILAGDDRGVYGDYRPEISRTGTGEGPEGEAVPTRSATAHESPRSHHNLAPSAIRCEAGSTVK